MDQYLLCSIKEFRDMDIHEQQLFWREEQGTRVFTRIHMFHGLGYGHPTVMNGIPDTRYQKTAEWIDEHLPIQ